MKTKRIWIYLAIGCLCVGALLAGAGFAMGGKLHNSFAVHFNWPHFGFGGTQSGSTKTTERIKLADFDHLTLNIGIGDIKVEQGKEYALYVKNAPADQYEITQDQGHVTITSIDETHFFDFSFDELDYEYLVTIPTDAALNSLEIDSNMGDVKLQDFNCRDIFIDQKMGDIKLIQTSSEKMTIDQKMGDIDYEGSHPGNMDLYNAMGDIELVIADEQEQYRYELSTSMGDIKTNNEKSSGFSGNLSNGAADAPYRIIVKNSMGDIQLEFTR